MRFVGDRSYDSVRKLRHGKMVMNGHQQRNSFHEGQELMERSVLKMSLANNPGLTLLMSSSSMTSLIIKEVFMAVPFALLSPSSRRTLSIWKGLLIPKLLERNRQ